MLNFITDFNNDLQLDSMHDIKMSSGIDAYRQDLINDLRLQQYEYPYDINKGINYLGYVMGRGANLVAWEAQIMDLVNSKSYIKRIIEWAYQLNKNNLEFILRVETDFGEIEIRG